MNCIAHFEFVSYEQFQRDYNSAYPSFSDSCSSIYTQLQLPRRATSGSAGYDFFAPFSFSVTPQQSILIPTGVRASIQHGWVLLLFPRSSLGFKYRFQLDNSVGVIDSDYYGAANEGHIFLRMTNDNHNGKSLSVQQGEAIAQGIFLPFGVTDDDHSDCIRTGGFGSTNIL